MREQRKFQCGFFVVFFFYPFDVNVSSIGLGLFVEEIFLPGRQVFV